MKINFNNILEERKKVLDKRKDELDKLKNQLSISRPVEFSISEIEVPKTLKKKVKKLDLKN